MSRPLSGLAVILYQVSYICLHISDAQVEA